MCFLHKKTNRPSSPVPMPTWEETVEIMYDRDIQSSYTREIIRVIYSADRAMRYLVIRNNDSALFYYELERLYQYDAFEWQYFGKQENALPGYWAPDNCPIRSIFDSVDLLMNELTKEPDYIAYFA